VQSLKIGEAYAAVHLDREASYLAADVVEMGLGLQRREAGLIRQGALGVRREPNRGATRLERCRQVRQRMSQQTGRGNSAG